MEQWYYGAKDFILEQRELDEDMRLALIKFLTIEMQTDFNQYVRNQGFDETVYAEEDAGVRFLYLKPFTLNMDESIDSVVQRFGNEITREQIQNIVEEFNEITPQKKRDSKDRLVGFWLDLVAVAPEWYRGEKFYVDVFVDLAGEGSVEFSIDDPAEIYQIALD